MNLTSATTPATGRFSRRTVLTGALASAALALPSGTVHAAQGEVAQLLLNTINDVRVGHGLPRLPEDHHLSTVSSGWSARMALAGGLSHNPNDAAEYGWPTQDAGEIVAYISDSRLTDAQLARAIVDTWMASSGHRAIILGDRWTDIGIGWAKTSVGRLYASANFIMAPLPAAGQEALALSQVLIPDASAPRIVISRCDVPVDAVAGAGLLDAASPMLFTRPGLPLSDVILGEISRAGTAQTTVYLVGGAIHAAAEEQVRATGAQVVRIAGPSRCDTAAMVAREVAALRGVPYRLHLVRADLWADAVSVAGQAAAHGWPVLLLDSGAVPGPTRAVLEQFPGADRMVIGGAAAVSDQTVAQFSGRRMTGDDRAATGVEVMRRLWEQQQASPGQHLVFTPGWTQDGWATALAHTTYSARHSAPVLFTGDSLPGTVRESLQQMGYTGATAPTIRFARHVTPAAQGEVRTLTAN